MFGTWEPEVIDPGTFQVSRLSVDSTVNFLVTHAERIEGRKHVYMQIACLYTNRQGQRLIRIHTLQLPVSTSLSNIFRYTEIDAVTNLLLKQAVSTVLSGNDDFRDKINKSCVNILHAYRTNCASVTSTGQLILPESLKLLPLYVGSIRKMAAFRSGSDIRVDDRVTALIHMLGLPMAQTGPLVYPRIFPLWPLIGMAGIHTGIDGNVHLPATIACSADKLRADCMYLVDNGTSLRLCIRPELPREVLQTVFQVDSVADVAPSLSQPFETASPEMQRLLAVIRQIRRERSRLPWQSLTVALPGTPDESRLLAAACEDRVGNEMNYVDFLCHLHKLVQAKQE
jgi:protein transport protein SEC24